MDKFIQTDECVTIGRCKISRWHFADDLVLLAFSESGLQHALNCFAAVRAIAGKLALKKLRYSISTQDHEYWVVTERVRSQMKASEMRFL